MHKFALALILALSLASSSAVAASYSYAGNLYSTIIDGGTQGTFTEAMSVSGTILLTTPLAPNLDEFDISGSLISFSFTNGRTTYTHLDVLNQHRTFEFSTDSDGEITGWIVQLQDSPLTGGILTLDRGTPTNVEDLGVVRDIYGTNDEGKILNDPGIWSVVPEPSTALLMGLGLAGLAVRRR